MSLSIKKKKSNKVYKKRLIARKLNEKKLRHSINLRFLLNKKKRIHTRKSKLKSSLLIRLFKKLNLISTGLELKSRNPLLFYNIRKLFLVFQKKPSTPSKRHFRFLLKHHILRKNIPLKSKLCYNNKSIGKNNSGQIVSWHHQVGSKRRFRIITNYRLSVIHQGIIEQLEYNPNHPCLLARIYNPLLNYHFYIRAANNLKIGLYIKTNFNRECYVGDSHILYNFYTGRAIHNLNLNNTNNIARSAGSFATILQKYKNYCLVQFPSKQKYYVLTQTQATLGRLSNLLQKHCIIGKAGRNRWLGRRPHVRGVAMNPIDHPHGGGQGKTCGGQPSVSAWGKPTKQIKHRAFFKNSKNKKRVYNLITDVMEKKKIKKKNNEKLRFYKN